MQESLTSVQEVQWSDVRDDINSLNPELVRVIDQLDPDPSYGLFRVRYPFGAMILHGSTFFIPTPDGSDIVPITDERIPQDWQQKLNYQQTMPMGMMLKRSCESYLEPEGRLVPLALMRPGHLFASWRALDTEYTYHPRTIWRVTAGARSLFMLPKITDVTAYRKLRRHYNINALLPSQFSEQWQVFVELANHQEFPDPWSCEMIFFSERWLQPRDDAAWLAFHHYLLQKAWKSSGYWRNKMLFDYMWDSFLLELSRKNIRPSHYLFDTAKRLVVLASGHLPAYAPAGRDQDCAPIRGIQEVYMDAYGLKGYQPTIMRPQKYRQGQREPIYYSLQFPNCFSTTLPPRTSNSIISDLRELRGIMERFIEGLQSQSICGAEGTPIEHMFEHVRLDYFHNEAGVEDSVRHTSHIVTEDPMFTRQFADQSDRSFCDTSAFLRGCIRIADVDQCETVQATAHQRVASEPETVSA